jgi:predicted methyltransferase MtxX (methanogen marker protein 4)
MLRCQENTRRRGGAVGLAALYYNKLQDLGGKKVVAVISGGNIYELSQRRRESEVALGERAVVLQLETRGHEHIAAIVEELRREGIRLLPAWKGARDHHSNK